MGAQLLLIFVAYHPSEREVDILIHSLESLPSNISYAVVCNDYKPGEPVDKLQANASHFLRISANLGYGRAVNKMVSYVGTLPKFIGILNTDLSWAVGTFESIIDWTLANDDVALVVPRIINSAGSTEKLCKQNPTILGMLSRRFIPNVLKPHCLKSYDDWYSMTYKDYNEIIESTYLSGCCMIARTASFLQVHGFDERYFLYLEDADLTRTLSSVGRCIYFPHVSVVHKWGRGNYKSLRLLIINLWSSCLYFSKWGLSIW